MTELRLQAGDVQLSVAPDRGGGLAGFHWRGRPVFADVRGPLPTDMACVPLLPFANRIAAGRFSAGRSDVVLARLAGEAHALHGQGWLAAWTVVDAGAGHAVLRFDHSAGAWPWPYRAWQDLRVTPDGYRHGLRITNDGDTPMPAGLGLHPWLPRTSATLYLGLHRGRWRMGADLLPCELESAAMPLDWWQGQPIASQTIDTCFTGRAGDLRVVWPEQGLALSIAPSPLLGFTHVYVPDDKDFFCIEPVSHSPDAIHRPGEPGLVWLAPGETLAATVDFRVAGI